MTGVMVQAAWWLWFVLAAGAVVTVVGLIDRSWVLVVIGLALIAVACGIGGWVQ